MNKLQDWQLRFEAFIKERQTLPFAWGTNDCAVFAADCVQALTGVDVALPELRAHTSELQAARLLKKGRESLSRSTGVPLKGPDAPAAPGARPPIDSFNLQR